MNKVIALLATAMMSLVLGCVQPSAAQDFMENPKFLRLKAPILGLNVMELREVLGRPTKIEKKACIVPLQLVSYTAPIPLTGTGWFYYNVTETTRSSLIVCVINNHAVGEQRSAGIMEGSRVFVRDQTLIDVDLIRKAVKDQLDETLQEERILPRYVPELEV